MISIVLASMMYALKWMYTQEIANASGQKETLKWLVLCVCNLFQSNSSKLTDLFMLVGK